MKILATKRIISVRKHSWRWHWLMIVILPSTTMSNTGELATKQHITLDFASWRFLHDISLLHIGPQQKLIFVMGASPNMRSWRLVLTKMIAETEGMLCSKWQARTQIPGTRPAQKAWPEGGSRLTESPVHGSSHRTPPIQPTLNQKHTKVRSLRN